MRRSALGTTSGWGGVTAVAPFELLVTVSFWVMVSFLFARAFYTKFEAWSVPLYIDTMGLIPLLIGHACLEYP